HILHDPKLKGSAAGSEGSKKKNESGPYEVGTSSKALKKFVALILGAPCSQQPPGRTDGQAAWQLVKALQLSAGTLRSRKEMTAFVRATCLLRRSGGISAALKDFCVHMLPEICVPWQSCALYWLLSLSTDVEPRESVMNAAGYFSDSCSRSAVEFGELLALLLLRQRDVVAVLESISPKISLDCLQRDTSLGQGEHAGNRWDAARLLELTQDISHLPRVSIKGSPEKETVESTSVCGTEAMRDSGILQLQAGRLAGTLNAASSPWRQLHTSSQWARRTSGGHWAGEEAYGFVHHTLEQIGRSSWRCTVNTIPRVASFAQCKHTSPHFL
ncbi:hypothetical protein DNTS_025985, partial [Danionella cerebrum]